LYDADTATEPVSASATIATTRPDGARNQPTSVANPEVGMTRRMRSSIPFMSTSKKSSHVPNVGSSVTVRSRSMSPPRPAAQSPTSIVSPALRTKRGTTATDAA
jgi:hypothetical protein